MYYKEEIEITDEDKIIIDKLGELLSQSKIDDYFYIEDLEFFAQLKLFTDEFVEAYESSGLIKYFINKHFYKWVTKNVIYKFTGLLESMFKGLLEQFEDEDGNGILTFKNCRAYRTYKVFTQSIEQQETTHDVSSRILNLEEEVKAYENNELVLEDTLIDVKECYCIRVDEHEKVDAKVRKELVRELRVLIHQRMCALLEANFKRANCVEVIQYHLILGILLGVIEGFNPRFKKEVYESYEVAKDVTVSLKSEFAYFKAVYMEFRQTNKNLIKL